MKDVINVVLLTSYMCLRSYTVITSCIVYALY